MYYRTATGRKIGLRLLPVEETASVTEVGRDFEVSGVEESSQFSEMMTGAAREIFEMSAPKARETRTVRKPAAFQDEESGSLRVVYKEIVLRFEKCTDAAVRQRILDKYGFAIRHLNRFVPEQCVVFHPQARFAGAELVDVANDWAEMEEVAFSIPSFVSEYRRSLRIHERQWHLINRGLAPGQVVGEDASILQAWGVTTGQPQVVVAVLDDGVDVHHPDLRYRIVSNPDPEEPRDLYGRDFFMPDDSPEHYDPRPRTFKDPYDRMDGNDIHGTPCAGIVAANGLVGDVWGVAPRCRILPVKIFHAGAIASDARVADAIRYAAGIADVLSCSWSGPFSPDTELAINEDAAAGRGGLGAAVFCAAGNDGQEGVLFPAYLPQSIAVGASTDRGTVASYSNRGPELSLVAPSDGGVQSVYCTDVSTPDRGFNLGSDAAGGSDGLHTNAFGGTSAATPLAAGVAALVLSVRPDLERTELYNLLVSTADKIGSGYNSNGHSDAFGFGRVNATKAVYRALGFF